MRHLIFIALIAVAPTAYAQIDFSAVLTPQQQAILNSTTSNSVLQPQQRVQPVQPTKPVTCYTTQWKNHMGIIEFQTVCQ